MPDIINSSFDPRLPFPLDVRQQVQDMNALYAIPNTSRWEGMLVYVRSSETLYILKGGVDNSFWLALQFNGGSGLLPNGIVVYGEAQQSANDILLNDAWVWRIDQVDYQSSDDVISITPAAAGNLRVDIIVGDNLGNFVLVSGTEVASPGPAIEPNIPADTVPLLRVDVNDTGITAITEFVLSAFVRYDINDQGLTPTFRQNARTNIQAVSKDTNDSRTGSLTNEGDLTVNGNIDQNIEANEKITITRTGTGSPNIFEFYESQVSPAIPRLAIGNRGEFYNKASVPSIFDTSIRQEVRSQSSNRLTRRDENYLTYPVTIGGTGKLNDVALADGVGEIKFGADVTEVSGIDANGDAKELLIWSDNPDGITLPAEDVLSIAANRFHREVNIPYQTWVKVVYDGDLARWVNGNTGELQETDARYFEVTDDVLTLKYILPDIAALQAFVRGPAIYAYVIDELRGGIFKYVSEADFSGSADFGISFPAQDGGYWVRDFEGDVDVRWYNAKGDGVTDDSDAVQAAANAIGDSGRTLFFPCTDDFYWFNEGLISLKSNTNIKSNFAKIKVKAGYGPFRFVLKENLLIEGLRFDGSLLDPGVPSSNPTNIFIGLENSDHITIRRCLFENMTNAAIYSSGSHFGLIENCYFYNIRRDISGQIPVCIRPEINGNPVRGSENWTVRTCWFINPDKTPSSIGAITANGKEDGSSPAKNLLIDNCYFEKMGRHEDIPEGVSGPRGDIDFYNDVYEITIQNCVSRDSRWSFVKGNDGENIKIINNHVFNCGERLVNWDQRYGITQNKDIDISGNVQIGGSGIKISHSSLYGKRFTVQNNTLHFNSTDNTAWGIRLHNIDSYAEVTGNKIKGSGIEFTIHDTDDEGVNIVCDNNTVDMKTIDGVITNDVGIQCFLPIAGGVGYPSFKLNDNLIRNIPVGQDAIFVGGNASAIINGTTYENILGDKIGTFPATGPLYINGVQEVDLETPDLSEMPSGMKAINVNTGTEFFKLQDGSVIEKQKNKEVLLYSDVLTTNVTEFFIDIPSGYPKYRIVIDGLRTTGNYKTLMQVSENGGTSYLSTGYDSTLFRTSSGFANSTIESLNTKNGATFQLTSYNRNASTKLNRYDISIKPGLFFNVISDAISFNLSDDVYRESLTGFVVTSALVNQLRLYTDFGSFGFGSTSCTIKLYGIS